MATTRSRSRFWAAVPVAVFVFAGWQTTTTFVRTPALNPSLLVETADGDRFPRFLPAMYSYPDYLYQVAYDWRQNPGHRGPFAGEGQGTSGKGMLWRLRRMRDLLAERLGADGVNQVAQANARNARDIVTESLRLQPGNAAAWILLARANDTLGDHRAALEAYLSSQIVAPRTTVYATMRLGFLEGLLEESGGDELARSMIDPEIVQTDIEAARRLGYKRLVESAVITRFLSGQPETR